MSSREQNCLQLRSTVLKYSENLKTLAKQHNIQFLKLFPQCFTVISPIPNSTEILFSNLSFRKSSKNIQHSSHLKYNFIS